MQTLAFHNTQFDVIDRDGRPWLQAAQIATALGYANANAVARIYARNSGEFTAAMTEKVNLTLSGNLQKEVRIFSLRGAHLVAMFTRTSVAAEFRRWVLDVLEKEAEPPRILSILERRWLVSFDEYGAEHAKEIPRDALVMNKQQILDNIGKPCGIPLNTTEMAELICRFANEMAEVAGNYSHALAVQRRKVLLSRGGSSPDER